MTSLSCIHIKLIIFPQFSSIQLGRIIEWGLFKIIEIQQNILDVYTHPAFIYLHYYYSFVNLNLQRIWILTCYLNDKTEILSNNKDYVVCAASRSSRLRERSHQTRGSCLSVYPVRAGLIKICHSLISSIPCPSSALSPRTKGQIRDKPGSNEVLKIRVHSHPPPEALDTFASFHFIKNLPHSEQIVTTYYYYTLNDFCFPSPVLKLLRTLLTCVCSTALKSQKSGVSAPAGNDCKCIYRNKCGNKQLQINSPLGR